MKTFRVTEMTRNLTTREHELQAEDLYDLFEKMMDLVAEEKLELDLDQLIKIVVVNS